MTDGRIKWLAYFSLAIFILSACTRLHQEVSPPVSSWNQENAAVLIETVEGIGSEGLRPDDYDVAPLEAALRTRDIAAINSEASALFNKIATDIYVGAVPEEARTRWHIQKSPLDPNFLDTAERLALQSGRIAEELSRLAPESPQYWALKTALENIPAGDAEKLATMRLNLERWRWMPLDPGEDYILVNVPAYEVMIVKNGDIVDRRRVIVGAKNSPTPQFSATVTGVAFNPTWFVPPNIVKEGIGAMLKDDPEKAARQGYYVAPDGNVRQKPGPANALGQMKLVMPNPYSVFLHDTPAKDLFRRETRALSHGCIRVEGALDFAFTLFDPESDRDEIAELLSTQTSVIVDLENPLPIYVTYFTAAAEEDGSISFYPDIYGLDGPLLPRFGAPAQSDADTPEDEIGCPAEE
jgi:murein L,D-transpeptidase YcbB/YkuD